MNSLYLRKEKCKTKNNLDISHKALLCISILSAITFVLLFKLRLEPFYYHFDDAFITYTFAKNLANGYGIVFHPELTPIQGSSSFFYTILIAALVRITSIEAHIIGGLLCVFSYVCFLVVVLTLTCLGAPNINNKTKLALFVSGP